MPKQVAYDFEEGRNESVRMSYDPKTGTWVKTTVTDSSSPVSIEDKPSLPTSKLANKTEGNTTQVDSQSEADKEVQNQVLSTLSGELSVTPSPRTFSLKTNKTVDLKGFGKYLSGLYYVQKITRTLSADSGYTQSLTVLKTGFGDMKSTPQSTTSTEVSRPAEVKTPSPTFKVGDKVQIYTSDARYSNAHEGVKVPAWVKKLSLTIMQVSKDGTRVLLKEIFSWTYVSNIKHID